MKCEVTTVITEDRVYRPSDWTEARARFEAAAHLAEAALEGLLDEDIARAGVAALVAAGAKWLLGQEVAA